MVIPKKALQRSSGNEHSPTQAAHWELFQSDQSVDGSNADAERARCLLFAQSHCSSLWFVYRCLSIHRFVLPFLLKVKRAFSLRACCNSVRRPSVQSSCSASAESAGGGLDWAFLAFNSASAFTTVRRA